MRHTKMEKRPVVTRLLTVTLAVAASLLATTTVRAAAPGITNRSTSSTPASSVFNLIAQASHISQPDGAQIYSWGYGCATGFSPTFVPIAGNCPTMQVPGPTLIVTEGDTVTVNVTNDLPAGVGNTSILFPGFVVTATGGVPGTLVQEATPNATVTYSFVASTPGTHSYYSGTKPDLQIEMGLYGALIVLPARPDTGCTIAPGTGGFKLSTSAYDTTTAPPASTPLPATCYDREYLTQWAEMDPSIHTAAEAQVNAIAACTSTVAAPCPTALNVPTEPYHPRYFLINGRSMPDDMDPAYAPNYPHQPYNGNPHMHPGDLVLLRTIGQGRLQHPFHEHGNHVRILARDGNLLLSQTDSTKLAGRMEFTTDTTPGQAFDGIFYWSGKGLNWDAYGHKAGDGSVCTPDANGYYTASPAAPNYYEWCADHQRPLEANPIGNVANGGPMSLPDPLIVTNGLWYSGTPYLGPDARLRAVGPTPLPPGGALQNPPQESGFAFMWHSHNEREITTNDVFPGGMMMIMLVDPPVFPIDETL